MVDFRTNSALVTEVKSKPVNKPVLFQADYLAILNLTLPYLTFGVGRLLHLPSAEAVSVRPNAQPQCNQKVTVIACEAEQITSHLGLVTCSVVVPIRQSALG